MKARLWWRGRRAVAAVALLAILAPASPILSTSQMSAIAAEVNPVESSESEIDFILPDERTIAFARMYNNIYRHIAPLQKQSRIIEHRSPQANTSIADAVTAEYRHAAEFFALAEVNVIHFSESEESWYLDLMTRLEGSANRDWLVRNCRVGPGNTCGMASFAGTPHFYHMFGSQVSPNEFQRYIAHHEAVHGFQRSYGYARPDRNNSHPNCWMIEGQAEALGLASALYQMEIDERRANMVRGVRGVLPNIQVKSKSALIEEFRALERDWTACFAKGTGYTVGFLMMEYLYLTFDVAKVHSFIKDFIATTSFDGALRSNLGISEDEFYSAAFDHIIAEYRRVQGS